MLKMVMSLWKKHHTPQIDNNSNDGLQWDEKTMTALTENIVKKTSHEYCKYSVKLQS